MLTILYIIVGFFVWCLVSFVLACVFCRFMHPRYESQLEPEVRRPLDVKG